MAFTIQLLLYPVSWQIHFLINCDLTGYILLKSRRCQINQSMQPCRLLFQSSVAKIACSYLILMYATRAFQAEDENQYIGLSLRTMYLEKIQIWWNFAIYIIELH